MTHPLDTFIRRFPNSMPLLWKGNIFHGESIHRCIPKGQNVMMADIGDSLLALWKVGIIQPVKFRPSPSGAAFLGLDPSNRRPHKTPHAGDAAHWDWEVVTGEYTFDIKEFVNG